MDFKEKNEIFNKQETVDEILKAVGENGFTEEEFKIQVEIYEKTPLDDSIKLFIKEVSRKKVYSEEENRKLLELYSLSNEEDKIKIRNNIVEHNIKLVLFWVFKKQIKPDIFLDIVQVGNIGLMRAIELYDCSKGTLFSSYASCHITSKFYREINLIKKNIHVPFQRSERISLLNKIISKFEVKEGRKPSVSELSELSNLKPSTIDELIYNKSISSGYTESYDVPMYKDSDEEFSSFIEDKRSCFVEEIINDDTASRIEEVLNKIIVNKRDIEIIKYKNGFYDNKIYSLSEIADIFGCSKENVRLVIKKAYKRLGNQRILKDLAIANDFEHTTYTKVSKNKRLLITNKTIYEEYSEFTKEEVDLAISKVEKNQRELLIKRYGNDYSKSYDGNDINTEEYKQNALKLRNKFIGIFDKIEKGSNTKKHLEINIVLPTIYEEYAHIELDVLNDVIEYLSINYRTLLEQRYGKKLKVNKILYNNPTEYFNKNENKLKDIIKCFINKEDVKEIKENYLGDEKMNEEIKKTSKKKTVYETFYKYSKSDIDEVLLSLSEDYSEDLFLKYGPDYNVVYNSSNYSKENKNRVKAISDRIKYRIEKYDMLPEYMVVKQMPTVYEIFSDYEKDEIDYVLNYINKLYSEQINAIFGSDLSIRYTGDDSISYKYKNDLKNIKKLIKTHLEKYRLDPKTYLENKAVLKISTLKGKTIYEEYEKYGVEAIEYVIKQISDRHYPKLLIRYGDDFNKVNEGNTSSKEYLKATKALKQLMNRYLNDYEKKYGKNNINQTNIELEVQEKEIIFLDDVKNEKCDETQALVSNNEIEFLDIFETNASNEEMSINSKIDPTLISVMDTLKDREKKIVALTLSYPASSYYSYDEIAKLFNVDVQYVGLVTKKVLLMYKGKVDAFVSSNMDSINNKLNKR